MIPLVVMQYTYSRKINGVVEGMSTYNTDNVNMDRNAFLISQIYTVTNHQSCNNSDESIIHQDWMGFEHLAFE